MEVMPLWTASLQPNMPLRDMMAVAIRPEGHSYRMDNGTRGSLERTSYRAVSKSVILEGFH